MKRKLISMVLTLCMVAALLPAVNISTNAAWIPWGYPTSIPTTPFSSGTGTSSDPFEIAMGQELANLAYMVNNGCYYESGTKQYSNACYELTADIVLNQGICANGTYTPVAGENVIYWTPIGSGSPFAGTFDGNNHTVSGIYINDTNSYFQGLFGQLYNGGTIRNVGIINSYISGGDRIGGVVGRINVSQSSASLSNCYNAGTVIANQKAGGIVGSIESNGDSSTVGNATVENCYNTGSVTATDYSGGIVGCSCGIDGNITFKGCYNTGGIRSIGQGHIGGIAGACLLNNSSPSPSSVTTITTIENCYNKGEVFGSDSSGGITGYILENSSASCQARVQYCYNTGGVLGTQNSGGIVGYLLDDSTASGNSIVQYCYNLGDVGAHINGGGILGYNEAYGSHGSTTVQYCFSTGIITGSSYQGGIVGYNFYRGGNNATVQYCYSIGKINGAPTYPGSIAGCNQDDGNKGLGTVAGCFYDKQLCNMGGINGSDTTGVTGKLTAEIVGTALQSVLGTESNWTFTNGLYPRLADNGTYDVDGTDAAYVAASPIFLYNNSVVTATDFETVSGVKTNFTASNDNGVVWTSNIPSLISLNGSSATVTRISYDCTVSLTAAKGSIKRSFEVVVPLVITTPETTPTAVIDFANEKLSGLVGGASYKVNGTTSTITADTSGKIVIDNTWIGTTISVIKAGNGSTTSDSPTQSLTIPSRTAAPTSVSITNASSSGANDGSITGVTGTMEYSVNNGSTWTNITGTVVTGLTTGSYQVRLKAVTTVGSEAFHSTACTATIGAASVSSGGGSYITSYTIAATEGEGGTISPTSATVLSGGSKNFTITANDGYIISDVLVDNVSVGAVSSYAFSSVKASHSINAIFEKAKSWVNPYSDINKNGWYYNAVEYVSSNVLMNGTSPTTFEPELSTSRAMIVTVLWRMEGQPKAGQASAFTDVADGLWYTEAIAWAADNKVVKGYGNGEYGPDDNVTREQMAAILFRYAQYKGYKTDTSNDLSAFADTSEVSDWAITAMRWAVAEGLISGVASTTLAPNSNASRAQEATALMRFPKITANSTSSKA